jgi:ribokinase
MFDVCVVGSANLDLVATVERLPGPGETVPGTSYREYPGGKGLNQAVAVARSGASCAFAGALGLDDAAALLLQVMHDDGIDTAHLERVSLPTGRALIFVAPGGENSIVVVGGANHAVRALETPPARVVLAQLEVPVNAIERSFRAARGRGSLTVLNPAPATPLPDSLLSLCDVLTPNEHEVQLLGGVDRLRSLGARAVIVTRGAEGADLHTDDGVVRVAPFRVDAVDATGAGDTFSGALCARLAHGEPLPTAARYASAAAALSTTRAGAVPSIPTAAEVQPMLA